MEKCVAILNITDEEKEALDAQRKVVKDYFAKIKSIDFDSISHDEIHELVDSAPELSSAFRHLVFTYKTLSKSDEQWESEKSIRNVVWSTENMLEAITRYVLAEAQMRFETDKLASGEAKDNEGIYLKYNGYDVASATVGGANQKYNMMLIIDEDKELHDWVKNEKQRFTHKLDIIRDGYELLKETA